MMPMTGVAIAMPGISFGEGAPRNSVYVGPDLALGAEQQAGHEHQEDEHLGARVFALFHGGLGRPGEERDDVLRLLLERRLGAVGIGHVAAGERLRHGDLVAGAIEIVVHAVAELEAWRRGTR